VGRCVGERRNHPIRVSEPAGSVPTLGAMIRKLLLPALAGLVVVGLAAPAGAQSTTTTTTATTTSAAGTSSTTGKTANGTTTSSPDAWASGVCSSVTTWLDDVDATVQGLTSASTLDAAADQAKTGIQDATDALKTSISDLGVPSTGDGKKAKKQIDSLTSQLDSLSQSIQKLLSNPGSNPIQIAGTLAQVGADVGKAVSDVQDTATALKGLKPNGALKNAFQTEPACTKLKKRV